MTVLSGTVIAQAIPVAMSLALTRLYTPSDLGGLAFYVSFVTIAGVISTGRYELAIHPAKRDREAFDVTLVAISLAIASIFVTVAGLLLYRGSHGHSGRLDDLGPLLLVLPFSVGLAGVAQGLVYWNNRRLQYRRIAASRVAQSSVMGGVQIVAGMGHAGAFGLISGYVAGQLTASLVLLKKTFVDAKAFASQRTPGRVRAAARRFASYPKYMIPGHVANVTSSQLPVLLLGLWYGPAIAGSYALAERVLVLPTSVVGSAIGDVFRQEASNQYHANGECRELFLRAVRRLAFIALIPLTLAVTLAPTVFPIVFGPSWYEAGRITSLLGFMVFFQLVSSPLSQTVLLADMYRPDLIWQVCRIVGGGGALWLGHRIAPDSYSLALLLYVACFSSMYVAHSILQYRAATGWRARNAGLMNVAETRTG